MAITKATASSIAPAAKGDLVVGSATNDSGVLAVGTANQVLTVDSSTATGLKWAAAGGGAYTLLSTTSLSGTTTSITGISGAYTDLMFIFNDPVLNTGNNFRINPNGSAGISYNVAIIGNSQQAVDQIQLGSSSVPTSSNTNNAFCGIIYQYSQTNYGKPFTFFGGVTNQNTSRISAGFIGTTSAITQLDFTTQGGTASWTGGQVLIYGVK